MLATLKARRGLEVGGCEDATLRRPTLERLGGYPAITEGYAQPAKAISTRRKGVTAEKFLPPNFDQSHRRSGLPDSVECSNHDNISSVTRNSYIGCRRFALGIPSGTVHIS